MAQIKDVSGTAFVVAEFRAEENREAAPLYQDPIVELFLNADTKQAAGLVVASFPQCGDLVRIRTKYFDDVLDAEIQAGVRQVVILGAGLDTRAVRKPADGVAYFEIDDPATLQMKRDCYRQHGIDANLTLIPGNYVTDGLIEMLGQNDFDFDLPTYLIWEGNTMYLPIQNVRNVLAQLRTYLKAFHISFDFMAEAVITKTTGDPGVTRLAESFARIGAPWISGIRDIQALANEQQLTVSGTFKTADLFEAFWPDRPMTSPIYTFYSVCTLGSSR